MPSDGNSDRNIYIAAAMLAAVIALAVGLFIWPNYRQAKALRVQTHELDRKIAALEGQSRELEHLKTELDETRHRIHNDFKQIPLTADLASLIRTLSQDVDRQTVFDQTFTAGSPSDAIDGLAKNEERASSVQAMPLTVEMDATFDAVMALLQNAESLNRLVRITNMRIACKRDEKPGTAPTTANGQPIVQASIGIDAIFEPQGDR